MYVYQIYVAKIVSGLLTVTSHRIYRLALLLLSPEMLSSLSKFLYLHLALFLRRMTQLRSHNPSVSIVIHNLTLEVRGLDNKQNRCGLGKNVNVRSSALKEVVH